MRKLLTALLAALLLCSFAAAEEVQPQSAQEVVEGLMADYGLSEANFSLSYYNTVTGEAYAFNDTKFTIAASTYKLPLNMYFYDMEREGLIDPEETFRYTGMSLRDAHRLSIVQSNNETSEAMMWYWGDHTTYKDNMRKYFTMTDQEIDPGYYQGNYFCVRMMMDALKHLYANQADYEELIGLMKEALPGEFFKRGVTDYEVAHKYGSVQWFYNDTGIIYTPQPYLLAVYTQLGPDGEGVCAEAAKRLTEYTVAQEVPVEEEPAEEETVEIQLPITLVETEPEPEPEPEVTIVPEPEPVEEPEAVEPVPVEKAAFPWWLLSIPAVLIIVLIFVLKRKKT